MLIASRTVSPWAANCHLAGAKSGGDCVIIDPGVTGFADIVAAVSACGRRVVGIVGTHGHLDHVGDAAALASHYDVPVWLHPADQHLLTDPGAGLGQAAKPKLLQLLGSDKLPRPKIVRDLVSGPISLAGLDFEVSHAPGHTAGSVLLIDTDSLMVFSGDVLFAGSIGRMDLPGGSTTAMANTIETVVKVLDPRLQVYPGHGPATSIAHELATNPYLNNDSWI